MALGVPNVFRAAPTSTKQQDEYLVGQSQQRQSVTNQYGPSYTPSSPMGYGPIFNYNSQQKYNPQAPPLPFNPTAGFDPSLLSGLGDLIPTDPFAEAQRGLMEALFGQQMRRQQQLMDAADAEARAGAGASGARIANEREKLGVQRGALDRQLPLIDELFGAREQGRGSSRDYLGKVSKQSQADYDQAMKVLDDALVSLGADVNVAKGAQQSQATASGAIVTQGNRDALSDIDRKHVEGQKAVENQRFQAGSARERERASIDRQWSEIAVQERIDKAQTAEDKAKIYDQYKLLDLMAKDLDISAGQVASQLDAALKKNKAQWGNLDSLFQAVFSGDPAQVRAAQDFITKNYPQGLN